MALPTTSVDTCLVCGAASHGVHFRVISCRACAAFFRRSLEASHLYKCRRLNKNCDVSKNAKHNCRYCRFQKCKRVGMRYQDCGLGQHQEQCDQINCEQYSLVPICSHLR
ncbi:hypothetical protein QR680_006035 [Steinernema hermaphroditum]|uniref:Nuclear receptor domain-containing protein n=1 Tax=Steinernema hermaphroditum TaxID=289476 RepID=A0AA39HV61_9BILA|nr:hypothetical protein QR680_006035 [Steinernema hermaphroditum]